MFAWTAAPTPRTTPQRKETNMHPFEKYNVTIGDDVVVAYATGDGSINAFGGEIGSSPKDEDLLLYLEIARPEVHAGTGQSGYPRCSGFNRLSTIERAKETI